MLVLSGELIMYRLKDSDSMGGTGFCFRNRGFTYRTRISFYSGWRLLIGIEFCLAHFGSKEFQIDLT